jgi:hypothetical protein
MSFAFILQFGRSLFLPEETYRRERERERQIEIRRQKEGKRAKKR